MDNINFSEMRKQLELEKQKIEERLKALNIMEEMIREKETKGKQLSFPEMKEEKYSFKTLRQACKTILSNSIKAMNRKEVTAELIKGGYKFQTNKPVDSAGTILRQLHGDGEIDLVKIKPGRNAYKAKESAPLA